MLGSPGTERGQGLGQGFAERREGIFDLRRNRLEVAPIDDAVGLQILELLDEHLVADASYSTPQLAIATGAVRQVEQDQGLPLASDHGQGGIQAAGQSDRRHFRVSARHLQKGAYWWNK